MMDIGMEICSEHCFISFIGQPFRPMDFSDLSLVITLQTMKWDLGSHIIQLRVSSFDSSVEMLDSLRFLWVKSLEKYEFTKLNQFSLDQKSIKTLYSINIRHCLKTRIYIMPESFRIISYMRNQVSLVLTFCIVGKTSKPVTSIFKSRVITISFRQTMSLPQPIRFNFLNQKPLLSCKYFSCCLICSKVQTCQCQ